MPNQLRPRRIAAAAIGATALTAAMVTAIPTAGAQPTKPAAASKPAVTTAAFTAPAVKHVWIIELENNSFSYTFGAGSQTAGGEKLAPYLTKTLPAKGALLTHYYGTGHDSLDNYTAEISGQSGNYQLNEDCGRYTPFVQFGGENFDKWTPKDHQLSGEGCVYPKYVNTIANQLTAKGLTWKAYEQDMGNNAHRDHTTMTKNGPACGHPKINGIDLTDSTGPKNDSYATRHDPFMYFHSITDDRAYCDAHVLSLKPLAGNLKKESSTPNYSFITPNTCMDAHDTPTCQDGSKGGLSRANEFLKSWVPKIMASPAYKDNGLILIMFDESGSDENAAGCCGEVDSLGYSDPSHPNMNEVGLYGPGGGRVGAVVLSKYVKPGTVSKQPYNHYSQLKTFEKLFGLGLLGDANQTQVKAFGADVFTKPSG